MSLTRGDKKLSVLTSRMIPEHIRNEKPNFEIFMKGFFRYLEQQGNAYDILTHIFEYGDIDKTADDYISHFKSAYAAEIPDSITPDFKLLIKQVKTYYRSKGSEAGFQFLLRFLFNSDAEFYYPKDNMLKTSDGKWRVPTYIRPKDNPDYGTVLDFYLDMRVQGEISGAEAWISSYEDLINPETGNGTLVHMVLDERTMIGTFVNGEKLIIIDGNKDFSVLYTHVYVDEAVIANLPNKILTAETGVLKINGKPAALKTNTDTYVLTCEPGLFDITGNEVRLLENFVPGLTQTAGGWEDTSGWLSSEDKLQDSYYYQEFSYVVISQVSLKFYKELLKDALHPAGYEIFGELQLAPGAAIETGTLDLFTTEYEIDTLEDGLLIVMSLNTVLNVIDLMLDWEPWKRTFGYYEAGDIREDPIESLFFNPCVVDEVTMAFFEDSPDTHMDYATTMIIARQQDAQTDIQTLMSPEDFDYFGRTVAASGDGNRVAISAYGNNGNPTVTIYTVDSNNGSLNYEADIIGPSASTTFGLTSISLNYGGDTLLVGDTSNNAVEVWVRPGGNLLWSKEDTIVRVVDGFGYTTSIQDDGNRIAIGAKNAPGAGSNRGEVYVLTRTGVTWSDEQIIVPTDLEDNKLFGTHVDLTKNGDRILITTDHNNTYGVYVFDRVVSTWTQTDKLLLSGAGNQNKISGDGLVIVINEPLYTGSLSNQGGAHIYEETAPNVWMVRGTIVYSGAAINDNFASNVAIDNTGFRILTTIPYAEFGGTTDAGIGVVYERNGNVWDEQGTFEPSDHVTSGHTQWGRNIGSFDSDDLCQLTLTGAPLRDDFSNTDSGAAYAYKIGTFDVDISQCKMPD